MLYLYITIRSSIEGAATPLNEPLHSSALSRIAGVPQDTRAPSSATLQPWISSVDTFNEDIHQNLFSYIHMSPQAIFPEEKDFLGLQTDDIQMSWPVDQPTPPILGREMEAIFDIYYDQSMKKVASSLASCTVTVQGNLLSGQLRWVLFLQTGPPS